MLKIKTYHGLHKNISRK